MYVCMLLLLCNASIVLLRAARISNPTFVAGGPFSCVVSFPKEFENEQMEWQGGELASRKILTIDTFNMSAIHE